MPPATPASILSSADRRSWRAWGWPVTVADPASAVVVFMFQGCRRRWPPSIRISPGFRPGVRPLEASGASLMPSGWPCRHGLAIPLWGAPGIRPAGVEMHEENAYLDRVTSHTDGIRVEHG